MGLGGGLSICGQAAGALAGNGEAARYGAMAILITPSL